MNQKVEIESEDVIESEESVSSNQEKLESKKKMKKVRSMKLQRLTSRGRKLHYDPKVRTTDVVEASPNYMKATGSSHAKDGFQVMFADSENLEFYICDFDCVVNRGEVMIIVLYTLFDNTMY